VQDSRNQRFDHSSAGIQRCLGVEQMTIRLCKRQRGDVSGDRERTWRGAKNGIRTAREETVLAENCYGIYEEQADVKYVSEEKHE